MPYHLENIGFWTFLVISIVHGIFGFITKYFVPSATPGPTPSPANSPAVLMIDVLIMKKI